MDEKELRKQAIKRYENSESPKEIYQSLGKSKKWFFKWLKRYQNNGPNWSEEHSRRPHKTREKLKKNMEQTIINTRKQLEKTPYAQIGALNIKWHLEQKGLDVPIPTINKVLKRNNLIRKKLIYRSKDIDYPALEVKESNFLHQFDVVGPRYLKTDGRFYSANIIDAYDRRCVVNPIRRQTKTDVLNALIRSWQILGIPKYLRWIINCLCEAVTGIHILSV